MAALLCAIARRRRLRNIALVAIIGLLAAPATASPPHRYYLALGDSLAVGMQPDADGHDRATDDGYVDAVGRRVGTSVPELAVAKLGCGGETTASMLSGGSCQYDAGSQLAQATAFLAAHRGAVKLVTIGIGDNDVERCFKHGGSLDRACAARGLAGIRSNLPQVLAQLRRAAGVHVPIVGVTDYDQFLALWLHGARGRAAARASVAAITHLNDTIDRIYRAAGVTVADARGRFRTADFRHTERSPGHGRVPVAVARICRWTWACSQPPVGFNDHANRAGYAVIARAVEDSLGRVAPRLLGRVRRASSLSPRESAPPTGGLSAGK